ncbi:MAG: HNH endonuclease [Phycisphaerales bacterium]|nr:MAG: HNH endonuclease [Phycisphaerales bacterium]
MSQRDKRRKRGRKPEKADCVIRQPLAGRQRAEIAQTKPRRRCYECVFYVSNALLWLRTLVSGFPIPGMCANHDETPGRWRPAPGEPCRNFRAKPRRVEPPEPPNDQIRYIPLTRGLHAIVDAEDYKWLSQYKWHAGRPTRAGKIYARRSRRRGGVILMHRQIMNPPRGMVVDHINGNSLDNRRCNLRICTQTENIHNSRLRCDAQSRFKGVYPKDGKWYARIKYRGQIYHLGTFDDDVEAAKARDRKALELYGQYAWLNFPPQDPPEA